MTVNHRRETKYTNAVRQFMSELGHATNAELVTELRKHFPSVSATTVHRVTARLHADGELLLAPKTADGAVRYDSNITGHDHFVCEVCGGLKDITVPHTCRELIARQLNGCRVNGSLTISGRCQQCCTYVNYS